MREVRAVEGFWGLLKGTMRAVRAVEGYWGRLNWGVLCSWLLVMAEGGYREYWYWLRGAESVLGLVKGHLGASKDS